MKLLDAILDARLFADPFGLDRFELGAHRLPDGEAEAARKLRPFLISKRSLLAILIPAAIPQIVVLTIEISVKDLLLGLVKTLE